jgi:hypothetical protein
MDRVHNPDSRVHNIRICSGPFNSRSRARVISCEEVCGHLVLAIHLGTDGCGGFSFLRLRWNGETRRPPWPAARAALLHAIGHHWWNRELLRDLDGGRYLICSLTTTKMGHRKRSMRRRLGRWLVMVKSFSSEAPASRSSPTSSSRPPLAPRPVQWLQPTKTTQNWWRLEFGGFRVLREKIRAMGCAIYRVF